MKSFAALTLLASAVSAHYTFPALVYNGETTKDWEFVRKTTNFNSHGPVEDVKSDAIRCYQNAPGSEGAKTMSVKAGDKVGFRVDSNIGHPGPMAFYMAKAPEGKSAADFDGSGDVWFKIYEDGPNFAQSGLTWPSDGSREVSATIPPCVASGDYLLRVEHIALHSAGQTGGAQFYLSCAQIKVEGGGSSKPAGVSFPGAYNAEDPGIKFNLYYPVPTSYTNPGPKPFTC
ncbi:fungal cellulose binding domain-containing protein [Apiospora kogelbergensis]|uniref:lytic cellulose monooxygenase (C4-dehydrogenating) n=1 Tax=Apiospora kogelbergensis TaxID=1337665 RepID=A0AAW0R7I6_9PEZI